MCSSSKAMYEYSWVVTWQNSANSTNRLQENFHQHISVERLNVFFEIGIFQFVATKYKFCSNSNLYNYRL